MILRCSRSLLLGACVLPLLFYVSGCGAEDKIPATLPVSGKVTIDDQPLAAGTISFTPDEAKGNKSGFGGFSMIKDGSYTITTGTANQIKNGALAGWYKVTVQTSAPMGQETAPKAGALFQETKSVAIDPKYMDVKQTPLEVEVKEGAPEGHYDFKIKSK
jgi:hypothetical protein